MNRSRFDNTMKEKLFQQSTLEKSFEYKLESKQAVFFLEKLVENNSSYNVSKRFVKKDDKGFLYEVIVKNRKNKEDNEIDSFLEILYNRVVLYTDEYGNIKSILNIGQIQELWSDIEYDFKKKFKKHKDINEMISRLTVILSNQKYFCSFFKKTDISTLLFPPIFFENFSDINFKMFQHKLFPFFFGSNMLPFKLLTSNVEKKDSISNENTISRIGFIDKKLFSEKNVKEMFREDFENPSLITDVDGEYSEMFYLEKSSNIINKSFQFMKVSVGDVFRCNKLSSVTIINN